MKTAETPRPETPSEEMELSPEMIEKIMEKVQDIERDGTAYHVMTEPSELPGGDQDRRLWQERLGDIFRHGLLGTAHKARIGIASGITPQKWIENVRQEKRGEVMFNVIGRAFIQDRLAQQDWEGARASGKKWIECDAYMWQPGNKVAVIFDLSKFEEVEPRKDAHLGLPKMRTFHADSPVTKIDEGGRVMAERGYGFSLYPRVPPGVFRGIVFKGARGYTQEEKANYLRTWGDSKYQSKAVETLLVEDKNPQALEQRSNEIVALMKKIYKDKPHFMVPVYDVYGNLWWPKKMSYAEVKALVSQRPETTIEPKKEGEKKYGRSVLEIGCGVSDAPWLEDRNLEEYHTAHIIRTDINPEKLQSARTITETQVANLTDKFNGKIEYITADATELPLEQNSQDEIYIANVFGEPNVAITPELSQKILHEATRVLKEGGEIVIAEWATPEFAVGIGNTKLTNQEAWKFFLDAFAERLVRLLGLEVKSIESPTYQPELSMLDVAHPEKLKSIFEARERYLAHFPYGKKFLGGLFIPEEYNQHPFIIVLRKVRPTPPPEKIQPQTQRGRAKGKRV